MTPEAIVARGYHDAARYEAAHLSLNMNMMFLKYYWPKTADVLLLTRAAMMV